MHSKSDQEGNSKKDKKKDGDNAIAAAPNKEGGGDAQNNSKKILFYTRFEKGTGGDEQLLVMIHGAIMKHLDRGAEIGIFLAIDKQSEKRAQGTITKLIETMKAMGFDEKKLIYWLCILPADKSTALLTQCIPPLQKALNGDKQTIANFIKPTKSSQPSVDLLIISGWAHQLNNRSADHIVQLKVPPTAKILLCAPPGSYVDNRDTGEGNHISLKSALLVRNYKRVYCLQPGIYASGGLIISPSTTLAEVQQAQTRTAWLSLFRDIHQLQPKLKETGKAKDELIVIYCSKDRPGSKGIEFIEDIVHVKKKSYPVLLIGTKEANENSENYKHWETLCREHGLEAYPLPRTATSAVLMRALLDAEYSMATGSFSILEAKKFGIHSCAYLAPPHLKDFGRLLETANAIDIERAFQQGNKALEELSLLPNKNFSPNILSVYNAFDSHELDISTEQLVKRYESIHKIVITICVNAPQIAPMVLEYYVHNIQISLYCASVAAPAAGAAGPLPAAGAGSGYGKAIAQEQSITMMYTRYKELNSKNREVEILVKSNDQLDVDNDDNSSAAEGNAAAGSGSKKGKDNKFWRPCRVDKTKGSTTGGGGGGSANEDDDANNNPSL